ncbi:MAG: hypothetical protein IT318_06655 [Anaerolineales bacterium]|nr:hypothetical protein [Anaerolineales bacterium]
MVAGLACGGQPDINATVNAVGTSVELTLLAMTQPGGTTPAITPAPPSATPPATLGIEPTAASPSPTGPPPAITPPAAASATATLEAVVRPNGVLVHAQYRATAPTIDAQGEDWSAPLPNFIDQIVFRPENWSGPSDQSASFALGWDANSLYLIAVVSDDIHAQSEHGELLYRGDSLELQLDVDLAGDFQEARLNSDDFQLGLSPGSNRNNPEAYLWNPAERRGVPAGLALVTRAAGEGGGYVLEAAIPWSMYGITPSGGLRLGLALNSSDNDNPAAAEQQSMLSSVSTRTLLNPMTWGTLQLDP